MKKRTITIPIRHRAIRVNPAIRRQQIVDATARLMREHPYRTITRREIADAVGISGCLITKYFGTMDALRGWVAACIEAQE